MKNFDKFNLPAYIVYFLGYFFTINFCRIFNSSYTLDLLQQQGYVITFSIIFTLLSNIWNYQKKHTILFIAIIFLYFISAYIKRSVGMILTEREIVHTIGFGTVLFSIVSYLWHLSDLNKYLVLKKISKFFTAIFFITILLPALCMIGYFIVSDKHLLSSDIILTLFQTNLPEINSYLAEQNLLIWGITFTAIITIISVLLKMLTMLKSVKCSAWLNIITGCFLIYLSCCSLPRLSSCFAINMIKTVHSTLKSFQMYEQNRHAREIKISNLQKYIDKNDVTSGIYVLVIGESTARDHMGVYGYDRSTTPWMQNLLNKDNAVIFTNAYSNHVHTVPSVQFALTSQNQYSSVELKDSYSIVDIANALGFKTYWISNQKHFSVANTPLTTIANTTDHQVWLNTYIGTKTSTTYYDEKLAENIPDLSKTDKVLIIVHLMGCHAVYIDRYNSDFDIFSGKNKRVDSYDNAVYHNDYVLKKLYDAVKNYPHFKAFVFFSDHGEDPDRGLTHESSKFTYEMSRIPLLTIFSNVFIQERKETFNELKKHRDSFWTSDLLYDMLADIIGFSEDMTSKPKYKLSSKDYKMDISELTTVHSERHISDDPHIKQNLFPTEEQ